MFRFFTIFIFIYSLFIPIGCASKRIPLDDNLSNLTINKNHPGNDYIELGLVSGVNGSGCGIFGRRGTYEGALTVLHNKASHLGANYVQIIAIQEPHIVTDCMDNEFKIIGKAFKKILNSKEAISESSNAHNQTNDSPTDKKATSESPEKNLSSADEIRKLYELKQEGIITQKEFEILKSKIIGKQ